jgi:uncharacterized protein YjiS (DUF1127 family)
MEVIMSQVSNTAVRGSNSPSGLLCMAGIAMKHWWADYVTRRVEKMAIAHLKSMSDRELHDIGLVRSQIEAVVRGTVDLERGHR